MLFTSTSMVVLSNSSTSILAALSLPVSMASSRLILSASNASNSCSTFLISESSTSALPFNSCSLALVDSILVLTSSSLEVFVSMSNWIFCFLILLISASKDCTCSSFASVVTSILTCLSGIVISPRTVYFLI